MKIIKKKSSLMIMVLSVILIFTACQNDKKLPTSGTDKKTITIVKGLWFYFEANPTYLSINKSTNNSTSFQRGYKKTNIG